MITNRQCVCPFVYLYNLYTFVFHLEEGGVTVDKKSYDTMTRDAKPKEKLFDMIIKVKRN